MTEPMTSTGKRLWNNPDIVADLAGGPTRYDLLAIEQEAAQQERERLRVAFAAVRKVWVLGMDLRLFEMLFSDEESKP